MGTTLSTLTNLAIYIALVIIGAFIGSRKSVRSRPLVWVGKLQFVALMILIVTLGAELGAPLWPPSASTPSSSPSPPWPAACWPSISCGNIC